MDKLFANLKQLRASLRLSRLAVERGELTEADYSVLVAAYRIERARITQAILAQ